MSQAPVPCWETAPSWARYLAKDADGDWFWFSHQPAFHKRSKVWRVSIGQAELAMVGTPSKSWRRSLKQRPQEAV